MCIPWRFVFLLGLLIWRLIIGMYLGTLGVQVSIETRQDRQWWYGTSGCANTWKAGMAPMHGRRWRLPTAPASTLGKNVWSSDGELEWAACCSQVQAGVVLGNCQTRYFVEFGESRSKRSTALLRFPSLFWRRGGDSKQEPLFICRAMVFKRHAGHIAPGPGIGLFIIGRVYCCRRVKFFQ
jgi:hypothetical protein